MWRALAGLFWLAWAFVTLAAAIDAYRADAHAALVAFWAIGSVMAFYTMHRSLNT